MTAVPKVIRKISVITIVGGGLFYFLTTAFALSNDLTQAEAVNKAEQFIKDNGYTTFPADKSKLSHELFDSYEKNIESILSRRYNTLQPKAFCISEETDSWHVGFLSSSIVVSKLDSMQRQTNLAGRAVIVNKNRKEIRIAHKTPLFSYFKKLLP